jgi:sodium/potassium/calcium exchanger 6
VLLLSAFAVLSLIADQSAKYRHGGQYGVAQRKAVAELDAMRLLKRDEEVSQIRNARH